MDARALLNTLQARRNYSHDITAPKHSISLALVVNEPKSWHSVQSNNRLGRVVDGHISSLEIEPRFRVALRLARQSKRDAACRRGNDAESGA